MTHDDTSKPDTPKDGCSAAQAAHDAKAIKEQRQADIRATIDYGFDDSPHQATQTKPKHAPPESLPERIDPVTKWPMQRRACYRCGEAVYFIKTRSGQRPYNANPFSPHHCGDAMDSAMYAFTPKRNRKW